jgi:hypothetical protein
MLNPTVLKRVIGCFGSSQLITALSVLKCREQEQQHLNYEYKNYLIIYDLLSPKGQIDGFAALVQQMAELACPWEAIAYLKPEQLENLKYKLNFSKPTEIFSFIHQLVGTDSADEVYLCRNWTTGDELITNSYPDAERICYGDGLGVYLPESYFLNRLAARPAKQDAEGIYGALQSRCKEVKEYLKGILGLRTILKPLEFDQGYFFLPNALGEAPPMKTVAIDKRVALKVMEHMRDLLQGDFIEALRGLTAHRPTVILLTANHAEQGRMTVENEILAYKEFLKAQNFSSESVLLIKPHPRDGASKIQQLKSELQELFSEIVLLTEANLFFIPFEVFLVGTFLRKSLALPSNLSIVTFSSACLSLELFFQAKPKVGFGPEIVERLFYEHCVHSRLDHESDLRSALHCIEEIVEAELCVKA